MATASYNPNSSVSLMTYFFLEFFLHHAIQRFILVLCVVMQAFLEQGDLTQVNILWL